MVNQPKECNRCQSLCCSDCLTEWAASSEACPKACQGASPVAFKDVHRYVKQDLLSLQFKCEVPECDFTGGYVEALNHRKACELRFQLCPQGCGLGVAGKDMRYHCYKQCRLFKIEDAITGEVYYPNDPARSKRCGGDGLEG